MGMGTEIEMEIEKMPRSGNGTIGRVKRPSGANLLRAAAAANSAKAAAGGTTVVAKGTSGTSTGTATVGRSSSVGRRAVEEARKALLRT